MGENSRPEKLLIDRERDQSTRCSVYGFDSGGRNATFQKNREGVGEEKANLVRFGLQIGPAAGHNDLEKVTEDQRVDHEESYANPSCAMKNLEDFPGQEGSGYSQGEVFCPGFFEVQADSFCKADGGINKSEKADPLEQRVADHGRAVVEEIDELGFGIQPQVVAQLANDVVDVFIEEMESGYPQSNKEEGQKAFIDGNQQQSARMPSPFRHSFGHRSDGIPYERLLHADTACLG